MLQLDVASAPSWHCSAACANSLRLSAERKDSALPAGGTASGKTTVCDQIMQRLHDQCVVMISQDSFYRGLTDAELANVQGKLCCAVLCCVAHRQKAVSSLSPTQPSPSAPADYNFDSPDAFDVDALVECLANLKVRLAWLLSLPDVVMLSSQRSAPLQAMRPVNVPIYDFTRHQRSTETRRAEPADVIVVEGILVLHMEPVRSMLNMKVSSRMRLQCCADLALLAAICCFGPACWPVHGCAADHSATLQVYVDTDDDVRLARR